MTQLPPEPKTSEITPVDVYTRRREFIKTGALYVATSASVARRLDGHDEHRPIAASNPPTSTH